MTTDFQQRRIERLRSTAEMQVPWERLPEIPRYSIGWRMGAGEDYWYDWLTWLRALSADQREDYRRLHPETVEWAGTYDSIFRRFDESPHGLAWDEFWDAELKTMLERDSYAA